MVLVSIRMYTKFVSNDSSKTCLWNVFWKVIFEKIFCNGSRLYKNIYKMFYLLENVLKFGV